MKYWPRIKHLLVRDFTGWHKICLPKTSNNPDQPKKIKILFRLPGLRITGANENQFKHEKALVQARQPPLYRGGFLFYHYFAIINHFIIPEKCHIL